MGDGSGEKEAAGFHMGHTEEPLFEQLVAEMEPEWEEMTGRYEMPEQKGEACELTISLEGDELDTGFQFTFGSESAGPPEELLDWVEGAVAISQEWWEDQRNRKRKNKK